jgi:hypothetical protein
MGDRTSLSSWPMSKWGWVVFGGRRQERFGHMRQKRTRVPTRAKSVVSL